MSTPIEVNVQAIHQHAEELQAAGRRLEEAAGSGRGATTPLQAYGKYARALPKSLDPVDATVAEIYESFAGILSSAAEQLRLTADAYQESEAKIRGWFEGTGWFGGGRRAQKSTGAQ